MSDLPIFRREALNKAFNGDITLVSAFEQLVAYVESAAQGAIVGAGAAGDLATASVLTLAPVDGWEGGRTLKEGAGIDLDDDGSNLTVAVSDIVPQITGGFSVTFIVTTATTLILPAAGTLLTTVNLQAFIAAAADYADDAAAAAGGVAVGGIYRTGSSLKVRVT